jgi:hypothetical protein
LGDPAQVDSSKTRAVSGLAHPAFHSPALPHAKKHTSIANIRQAGNAALLEDACIDAFQTA